MVTPNSPFKPSPLSFGSTRTSPFRRQSSPNSPSTTIRQNTPGSSPGKGHTPVQSPSKLNQSYTATVEDADEDVFTSKETIPQSRFGEATTSPRGPSASPARPTPSPTRDATASPSRSANSPDSFSSTMGVKPAGPTPVENDAMSRLPPAQLREIREAFQVLDRDNDGSVNRDDVADVLKNLGQDSSASAAAQFFPPGGAQTINLSTFMNTISTSLASLSTSKELQNALAAFDDDDSGQIDVAELRDALLHTSPEAGEAPLTEREIDEVLNGFTGRRAFGSKSTRTNGLSGGPKKGEVFRYQEFLESIMGGPEGGGHAGTRRETGPVKG
ncbi:hypothetical protein VTN02DRAFT_137 [Thermoascus thermophilus]